MAAATTDVPEPIRVLYIDGDAAAREAVAEYLTEDDRFTVETAGDVETAWNRLGQGSIDCVVSAYELPGTTGLAFLERFREEYPDRPFLLHTEVGSEVIPSDAIAAVTASPSSGDDGTKHGHLADRIESAVASRTEQLPTSVRSQAMDEAPLGITIADTSKQDEPLIYVNDHFQELTGYDSAAALGRNCRFLQGAETAAEPVERLRRAIEAGETESVELLNYRRDGSAFWNRVMIAPLTGRAGEDSYFVGFQEDVTEARERDRRQREVVSVLRELYDVTTDTERTLEEKIDRALELGREVLGMPYGFLTRIETGEDPSAGTQTIVRAIGSHELLQPEASCPLSRAYCRKTIETDGLLAVQDAAQAGWAGDPAHETFDLGSYIGGKVVVDGGLYGTLCFAATDPRTSHFSQLERTLVRMISKWVSYELEHREARRELERQNDRLEEFASVVSHDVQNPLNVAQGRLQMAQEECESPHLDDVEDALDRIGALVTDLLEMARHGEGVTDLEAVDLGTVVDGCWGTVDTERASLQNRASQAVRADENQLKQVIENLVNNAVTHGGDGVTVTVGDLEEGFFIEDDGGGIPADARESVFDVGYTSAEDGTGFGLNIVQQIAQSHGWDVTLTESEGGGARFEFTGVTIVE